LGIKHKCWECDLNANSYSQLYIHYKAFHEGVTYSCDQCEHVAKAPGALKAHKITREDNRLVCDQCEFVAKHLRTLKFHRENIHEKIRYHCDLCDFVATAVIGLNYHKQSKHETTTYPCDQCDYIATLRKKSSTTQSHPTLGY